MPQQNLLGAAGTRGLRQPRAHPVASLVWVNKLGRARHSLLCAEHGGMALGDVRKSMGDHSWGSFNR